jgi:integrase
MASVCCESNGRKYIQVNELPGRPKLRLGKASDKVAKSICAKVEAMIAAKLSGQPVDPETAVWLGGVTNKLHGRLERLGLVQPRGDRPEAVAMHGVFEAYISKRARLKPNTLRNYRTTKRLLEEHFGKDRPIGSIHAGHARDCREWLAGKYAPATVAREIKRARQFFEYAKDHRLVTENPFAKIKAGSQKNTKRKHFVDRDVIEKVLAACPDNNWRLSIVLGRYAGLRIPSEFKELTWGDVDWDGNRFTVRVPKKEHIDGHETRIVPIFPEIKPYLRQAFDEAPAGSVHVLRTLFHGQGYVYAGVLRAVERASLQPWPKLLQNLRASRETELMQQYPAHVVHAWLGNSREVAEDHYLMVTDADYARAAADPAAESAASNSLSEAVQKAVQSVAVLANQEPSPETETAVLPAIADCTAVQVPPRGVEPRFSD